jgi:hypothetical protein
MLILWRDNNNAVQFLFAYFMNSRASGQLQMSIKQTAATSQYQDKIIMITIIMFIYLFNYSCPEGHEEDDDDNMTMTIFILTLSLAVTSHCTMKAVQSLFRNGRCGTHRV